ncbi:pseudouridine synthase [Simiduia curdlanivorans]|uniref:Pseudouridine synthase n=1 Tax=Simiduia curdlanivorans TaxID=1492769 RepID=A0ABV8V8Q9_9GAMM|nr:pseudouridine synthase [Simiduia curdlanivorans]MDN3639836.1 pseudouridine synthase [Simiduia curdlanivorans]
MTNLILLNKPYQMMCQFTDTNARRTLAELVQLPNFYPAGRLDFDSEGLVLLTNDGLLQNKIADPRHKLPKTYWVQVEGELDVDALDELRRGVQLKDGLTKPAQAKLIAPPSLWDRTPPVRYRKAIPDSWLELTITEGKNRQVRRMTAAVGHPTLRLVRVAIGPWQLGDMQPGDQRFESVPLSGENTNLQNRPHKKATTRKRTGKTRSHKHG